MAIEAYGLILQLGFVNNLGPRRARRAGSLLIALGVMIASIIWWQNFYSQMIGRAPVAAVTVRRFAAALKIVAEFEQSLKKYPPIAPGTPDPYAPLK